MLIEVPETISMEGLEAMGMLTDVPEDMVVLVVLRLVSIDDLSFESMQRLVPQSRISCGRH